MPIYPTDDHAEPSSVNNVSELLELKDNVGSDGLTTLTDPTDTKGDFVTACNTLLAEIGAASQQIPGIHQNMTNGVPSTPSTNANWVGTDENYAVAIEQSKMNDVTRKIMRLLPLIRKMRTHVNKLIGGAGQQTQTSRYPSSDNRYQ